MGPIQRHLFPAALFCAASLIVSHASVCAEAAGTLSIEGFEAADKAAKNAAVKIVASGPGVTQGKAAAQLAPDGAVTVTLRGADIAELPWLRMDTSHAGDGTRGIRIDLSSGAVSAGVSGYVAAGADTLAYPLSMIFPPATITPDPRTVSITITNISDTPIVVDNIRLEPLVRTPRGAVLWDFGKTANTVWPGFKAHRSSGNGVKWKESSSYYSGHSLPYPDPLTQDFIGPYSSRLGNGAKTQAAISAPEPKSSVAWVWLTHYGKNYTQPQEYAFRASAGRPIRRSLTAGQMVGPDGLLEGARGDWTPKWFAADYANHFVTLTTFSMPRGVALLEFSNCQLAAMAIAPASRRSSMAACVKRIEGELVRFRRQFVMKHLNRNICRLEPTDAEKKAGVMLLRPPADEAFTGRWKPRADQRAWALRELSRPGGTIHIPLAFVPLQKKSISFRVTPGTLRSESNTILLLNQRSIRIDHLHDVADVRKGVAVRRPWLLSDRSAHVEAGRIGYLWATISIPPKSREGVYRGTWKFSSGSARVELPVEIEIADCGPPTEKNADDFTIGSYILPSAATTYYAALSSLPQSKQLRLKRDVFKQASEAGIGAYVLPGVTMSSTSSGSHYPSTSSIQSRLDEFPLKDLPGPMFVNTSQAMRALDWGKTDKKRILLRDAIATGNELSEKYSIDRRYFYFGLATTAADGATLPGLNTMLAGIKRFASDGCRAAVHTLSSALNALSDAEFREGLKPVSVLILAPDSSSTAGQIAAFRKLPGIKKVYLYYRQADRFAMGFYASAVAADGCFLSSPFMKGPTYNGYQLNGYGLITPQLGGELAQTVSAFRLRQAAGDRALFSHARTLVSGAAEAAVSAAELSDVLSEIESRSKAAYALGYDYGQFSTTAVSQAEMDSWRSSLLNAAAIVNKRILSANR